MKNGENSQKSYAGLSLTIAPEKASQAVPGRHSGPNLVRLFLVVAAVVPAAMMAAVVAAVVAATRVVRVGRRSRSGGCGLGHCGNRAEQGGGGKQVLFHA